MNIEFRCTYEGTDECEQSEPWTAKVTREVPKDLDKNSGYEQDAIIVSNEEAACPICRIPGVAQDVTELVVIADEDA